MATVIVDDEKNDSTESGENVERDLGKLENEVDHVAEDVEAVEERLEEVEQRLEWNSQERQAIWNKLDSVSMLPETVTQLQQQVENLGLALAAVIAETETEAEADQENPTETMDQVINDLPTEPPADNPPAETQTKPNLLKRILFG